MAEINLTRREYGFGKTYRKDSWWVYPLFVFIALSLFVIYVTWAAWQGNNYWWGPYLSPLYSPEFFGSSPHRWFGPEPKWWPTAIRSATWSVDSSIVSLARRSAAGHTSASPVSIAVTCCGRG